MKKRNAKKVVKTRFNRGAILAETFVAISIILLMTGAFVTLATFANSSFKNSQIISAMSQQVRNVQNIFIETEFVAGGAFSYGNLENSLQFVYGEVEKVEGATAVTYKVYFDNEGQLKNSGEVVLGIALNYTEQKVEMNVCVQKQNKVLIENSTLQKAVIV